MISLHGNSINTTIFPDNTSQVWNCYIPDTNKYTNLEILWEYERESELFHLAQYVTLLYNEGFKDISLKVPYLPYARQDKDISNDNTFALHVFAMMLNSMWFTDVFTYDVHSEKAFDLIRNLINIPIDEFIYYAIMDSNPDIILFPDKGALNRYSKLGNLKGFEKVYCSKNRDQKTGYIKEMIINGNLSNKNILIIDDICDGGMTFKLISEKAKQLKAKNIDLYITHGIFSKGLKTLRHSGINNIYTIKGKENEK